MKRNFTNINLIFVIVLFCVILTGCAKKTEKTTIQFASWGSKSEIEILKPILAEFGRENPDINVDFVHIPQNYFQKIHLLFASNLAPDVIFINNLYLPIYANAGLLEEVKSEKQKVKCEENAFCLLPFTFYPKALEALSYNGKLYAVPRDVSNLVIYYNKDLFDKYKVPYPNKNWTFDDFLETAQKLTKDADNDGKTDTWGTSFEKDPYYYLPYLMSEGGGILSDDLKTSIIDTPQSKKGLKFYADLRNKYHVAPTDAQSASATMAQLFLQEQLGMYLSGRWMVPKFREDATFNWDIINFPKGDKGSIVPMDASGWAISKNSKHKDAAVRLIKYLASKESIEKFNKSGLIVPARTDVSITPNHCTQKGEEKINPPNSCMPANSQVFIDVIQTSKKTPVSVNYNEVQDELKEANPLNL